MILGFKQQFKAPIETGVKIHTIREDRNDRWSAGKVIHFCTGVRTKFYECFKIGKCVSVQSFSIQRQYRPILSKSAFHSYFSNGNFEIFIDGKEIDHSELMKLAENDGFDKYALGKFCEFFMKRNKPYFKGKIIHWTDFRY